MEMKATRFEVEIMPMLPRGLQRLSDLAGDLYYSWDRRVRQLFSRLDRDLWESCGHNPKLMLRRVSQERLDKVAADRGYMRDFRRGLAIVDAYRKETMRSSIKPHLDPKRGDLVAYFCAEFGLHESVPIYSGGLGILAGDHCKAASDLGLPFVAVGLLYREGYFTQEIDGRGQQIAVNIPIRFEDLPIEVVTDDDGRELHVQVTMPGADGGDVDVQIKVWRARVGKISLYLLDTDLPENGEAERAITHQLYGGHREMRIRQEVVLGIGGVRALRALGLSPSAWHINEGHSAFMVLERCREAVTRGMGFDAALELVAAGTVFTTHTPVSAGHDIFDSGLFEHYFGPQWLKDLGITRSELNTLGQQNGDEGRFNMTSLALRGSRSHNGVSRIHGRVAARMEFSSWPQLDAADNPLTYVTNGVHLTTFLATSWVSLFDMRFVEWRNQLNNPDYWDCIDEIPMLRYWSERQELKAALLTHVRQKAIAQHTRNGLSATAIRRAVRLLDPDEADILVLGFARRFATYKRATLLFGDPERLARVLGDADRPVLIIFAGKAHPHDDPGQELIRRIYEYSMRPEFIGKILLLEGYDMALARKLVSGVDVWLNNPEYPLEASGTSGQKAAMNGAINLSVLDGWWGEGYDGTNGWAISPHEGEEDVGSRAGAESRDLLDILENEVVPLYYEGREHHGCSPQWVRMSKASMKTILPRFNAQRMVEDYVQGLYGPAAVGRRRLLDGDSGRANELATWKQRVRERWSGVSLELRGEISRRINHNDELEFCVAVDLNGLGAADVKVECLIDDALGSKISDQDTSVFELTAQDSKGDRFTAFTAKLRPGRPGLQSLRVRMYPHHELLSHPLELGFMVWL